MKHNTWGTQNVGTGLEYYFVILLTMRQVPTGEEEMEKKKALQTMPIKMTIKM